jgi:hypothetical protein
LQTTTLTTLDTLVRSGALLSPSLVMGDDSRETACRRQ